MDGRTTKATIGSTAPQRALRGRETSMKLLQTIDQQILAFWYTAPQERLWAYLATFPMLVLVIDALKHIF